MSNVLKKAIQKIKSSFIGLPTNEKSLKELSEGIDYLIDAANVFSYEHKSKRQEVIEECCRIRQIQMFISINEFTTITGGMKELVHCLDRLEKIA